jgi:hypothetical protein
MDAPRSAALKSLPSSFWDPLRSANGKLHRLMRSTGQAVLPSPGHKTHPEYSSKQTKVWIDPGLHARRLHLGTAKSARPRLRTWQQNDAIQPLIPKPTPTKTAEQLNVALLSSDPEARRPPTIRSGSVKKRRQWSHEWHQFRTKQNEKLTAEAPRPPRTDWGCSAETQRQNEGDQEKPWLCHWPIFRGPSRGSKLQPL